MLPATAPSGEGDHGLFEIQLTGPGGRPLLEEEGEVTAEDSIMAMACEAVQTMDEFKATLTASKQVEVKVSDDEPKLQGP